MKSPLYVIMVTIALLVTLTLPALSSNSVISGGRAGGRQISHEQVARRGANAVCQSVLRVRRLSESFAILAICAMSLQLGIAWSGARLAVACSSRAA